MSSPGSPADARSYILERLIGDSGDAANVIGAGRAMAERAVPAIQTSVNEQLAALVTVDLQRVEVARVADARSDSGEQFALAVIASSTSSDALTIVMDSTAISIMICALFGGDLDQAVPEIARDFSPIEMRIAGRVIEATAAALNGSGKRSLDLKLPMPPVTCGEEARRRVLRDGPGLRMVFGISTPRETGTIVVMIPQRVLLTQRGGDPNQAPDAATANQWRTRFSEEVMRSAVNLEATMPLARLTLGDIASFRPGQVVEIEETAQHRAHLGARGKTLFVCEFGKLGQNYTVRVKQPYDAGQEFIDGLMPG